MKKYLKYFLLSFLLLTVSSCANQNLIMSLSKVKNSILKIETWASLNCDGEEMSCPKDRILSTGTGAVVLHDNRKHVLTAAHICVQNKVPGMEINYYFKAIDQNSKQYVIKIINYDAKSDVCLLRSVTGELGCAHGNH